MEVYKLFNAGEGENALSIMVITLNMKSGSLLFMNPDDTTDERLV